MTKKGVVSCLLSVLFCCVLHAQTEKDSLILRLNLKYNNQPLELNTTYYSKTDTLQITSLRFYLSGIEFKHNDGTSSVERNSFHLIDASDKNSLRIPFPKNKKAISKIRFNIGIDSTASVSGALENDLDPTKGMYWAWQSGYINLKLEGTSTGCTTRKNKFQFHIGGYLKPFYAMKTVEFPLKSIQDSIDLNVNVDAFFEGLNLAETNTIMIPGAKAMELANASVKMFSVE